MLRRPKLKWYQREDVEIIKGSGCVALVANSPGTGKTAIACTVLSETADTSLPALVICPSSVLMNWRKEFGIWAPEIRTCIVDDMTTNVPKFRNVRGVYITSWALLDARWEDFVKLGIKGVVADEAHFSKNPDALRSQALFEVIKDAKTKLALTGTPIVNNEKEMDVIKSYLGDNPVITRRLLEEVEKDVPEKTRYILPIELRDVHRDRYDKADKEFEEWLRTEREQRAEMGEEPQDIARSLASQALVKIGYLRRMVGEFKVPAAADWVTRAVRQGEPVVVFFEHQHVLNRMERALARQRIKYLVLDGGTPKAERQKLVDAFQAGEAPVFLGSRAAAVGITLTRARHLLFMERFFTSADEDQAEDRIRRIGQTRKTKIWRLHALDTIDDRLEEIINTKRIIIKESIGAAEIEESDLKTTEDLIRDWSRRAAHPKEPVRDLGQGVPPPPLPQPFEVHAVTFWGLKWTTERYIEWCKINGYGEPIKILDLQNRVKLVLRDPNRFKKGTFKIVRIGLNIRIITGSGRRG